MSTQDTPPLTHQTRYAELPTLTAHPGSRCAWRVFGPNDEFGTLNRLNPERVQAASAFVQSGKVFSLNWAVELPDPPLFSRRPVYRTATFGYGFADDKLDDFYLQGSTQWDSLVHASNPEHGFYNEPACLESGLVADPDAGIHTWAQAGIAGRFVLADVERWRAQQGRPLDPTSHEPVPLADLLATLQAQNALVEPGDILLLRFGWVGWYEQASPAERQALASSMQPSSVGLAADPEVREWLWDSGVAAVAADNPAVEATPTTAEPYDSLHFTLLPLLGMPLGELFVLDELARDCAQDGRYHGLLTSAPLNVRGGVGSPANALCLK